MKAAALLLAVVAVGLAAADPAAAVPGLFRAENHNSGYAPNSSPVKLVVAGCPKGSHILGGGAQINEPGAVRHVRLTRLEPVEHSHPFDTHDDLFYAQAEAFDLSYVHDWSLDAYAVCAYKPYLLNWQIKTALVADDGGAAFQAVGARCPDGTVAWGSGGRIDAVGSDGHVAPSGQIGLQLTRTTGPLDAVRVTARESRAGYNGQWHLFAFAICASRFIRIYQPQAIVDTKVHAHSSTVNAAYGADRCPAGYRTHGIGGGGGVGDSGYSWLHGIVPHLDLRGVSVEMTSPLAPSIGGMVVHETCAKG